VQTIARFSASTEKIEVRPESDLGTVRERASSRLGELTSGTWRRSGWRPGGSARPKRAGVVGKPSPQGAAAVYRSKAQPSPGTERRKGRRRELEETRGKFGVRLGELAVVEGLAQEDGGQGALLGRNEQGWWADRAHKGAAADIPRQGSTEPGNREEKKGPDGVEGDLEEIRDQPGALVNMLRTWPDGWGPGGSARPKRAGVAGIPSPLGAAAEMNRSKAQPSPGTERGKKDRWEPREASGKTGARLGELEEVGDLVLEEAARGLCSAEMGRGCGHT